MTFALSGSNITQSGTDADLSGLAGVSGVTTFVQSGKTVYNIGNRTLAITGTLTQDPRTEEIWTGSAVPLGSGNGNSGSMIRVTGTYNLGVAVTKNGVQAYPQSTAIRLNTSGGSSYGPDDISNYGGVVVASGGVWNWYFGTIFTWGPIGFGSSANSASGTANVYSKSCQIISLGTSGGNAENPQVRVNSTQTNVQGMSTIGMHNITLLGNPAAWANVDVKHHTSAYGASSSSPDATYLTVTNYESGGGHTRDWGVWQGKWYRFVNAVNGSNYVMGSGANSAANYGLAESRQALTITAKNAAGSAIASGGWFVRDKNNGLRLAANGLGNGKTNADYVSDRTYAAAFNGSGIAAYSTDGGILTHVGYRVYANAAATPDTATENKRDYRGETNDNADSFIARVRSYGYAFTELSVTLKGANGTAQNVTLFSAPAVVQASATAQAHTGITLTDHGGSPVSWNSKSWGITVTGNLSTNPALTAADIYHYLQYHLAQVGTTINGKLGGEWHEMVKPSGTGYATETGTYGGARSIKGVRVVDQSGNPFPGFVSMQADDGTTYTPPVSTTVTIAANTSLVGAEVRLYDLDNVPAGSFGTELSGVESCPSVTYSYSGSAGNLIAIQIMQDGYVEFSQDYTIPANNTTLTVTLASDTNT